MDSECLSTPKARHYPQVLIPELAGLRRPLWRHHVPAVWRDATSMQLADDVIIDRLSPHHIAWLRRLDGSSTADDLAIDMPIGLDEARRLVRCLLAAGALVDAARLPAGLRFAGPAGRAAVMRRWDAVLDTRRDLDEALRVVEARDRLRVAITGTGELRDAIAAALEASGLVEVAAMDKATCLVLADAHHPDVPALVEAGELDLPHLHVGARGDRATIGPLVVPGVTACLRCAHLHQRDRDRAWPLMAVQWSQSAHDGEHADPLVVGLAAAHAVHLLRSWADAPGERGPWADLAVELRLSELTGRCVPRPAHPLCGCRWAAA